MRIVDAHTRESLRSVWTFDRSKITTWGAVRVGLVTFGVLSVAFATDNKSLGVPLAIAVLFVGVADAGETVGRRWRTMLWATTWLMIATGLGGLASDNVWLDVPLAIILSLVFGAAGMLGPRPAIIGLLSLVLFAVFSGAPESTRTKEVDVLMIGLGGLVITAVTILPHLIANREAWRVALVPVPSIATRLRGHITWTEQYVRHAARLCVVVTLATAMTDRTDFPHDYWLPMTVAWVTKPDVDGTVSRIFSRVVGTFVGVLVVVVAADLLGLNPFLMGLLFGCASALAVAFIWSNYAVAVTGVTTLVVGLFTFDGDPVWDTIENRVLFTVLAGLMVFGGTFLWREKAVDPEPAPGS